MARVVQVGSDKVILDGYRILIDAAHPIHDWSVREFCQHPIYFEGWKYQLVAKRRIPKPYAMRYELQAWPENLHEASTREFTYDEDFVAARDAQFAAEGRHTILWCLLLPLYPILGFCWSGFKERVLWPIGFVPASITKVSVMVGFSLLIAEAILYGWLGSGLLPLLTHWTFHWGFVHDVPDAVLILSLAWDCATRFDQIFLNDIPVPDGVAGMALSAKPPRHALAPTPWEGTRPTACGAHTVVDYTRFNGTALLDLAQRTIHFQFVLRRIGHLLVVTALLAGIGGHWAILQSFAWATMLADNLHQRSLTEAVSNTFDGEHPCAMCKHIDQAKKSERKSDGVDLKVKKLEFATEQTGFVFTAPSSFQLLPLLSSTAHTQSEAPPVPPPRLKPV